MTFSKINTLFNVGHVVAYTINTLHSDSTIAVCGKESDVL